VPSFDLGIALSRSVGGFKFNIDIAYAACSINSILSSETSEVLDKRITMQFFTYLSLSAPSAVASPYPLTQHSNRLTPRPVEEEVKHAYLNSFYRWLKAGADLVGGPWR
jgi:hypothetical protein